MLGFGLIGPPYAAAAGLATDATMFANAMAAGNLVEASYAVVDAPAFFANGFLNGETIIDFPINVSLLQAVGVPLDLINVPFLTHFPLDGLLVPPHPVTATLDVDVSLLNLLNMQDPINITFGGTPVGGLIPELFVSMPEAHAAAIAPSTSS